MSNLHPYQRLAAGVHAAAVADDVVFLAVADDRYLCLPAGAARLRVSPDGRAVATCDAVLREDLLALGLVGGEPGPATRHAVALPALPTRDVEDAAAHGVGFRDLAMALACVLDALIRYRGRSLADLAAGASRGGHGPPCFDASLVAEVQRYRRVARWLPLPRKCLLQSFLLLRHLRRVGHDAAWVFAVRTWPFEAHCWLQVEDAVLDDRHERLVAFTPLMVV